MGKGKIIFRDKAGNVVVKRFIKTRGVMNYSVKNKAGRLVNPSGTQALLKKAGIRLRRR